MKKYIIKNIKVITAFIIGIVISGGVVYAAVSAEAITYSNKKSGLKDSNGNNVENVQDAIDVLYNKTFGFNSILDTSVGSQVSIGGYIWHIIGEDEDNFYLLMDQGQLPRKYLCDRNDSPNCSWSGSSNYTYSWVNSTVRSYLNGTFYNSLPEKVKSKLVATEICKDPSNGTRTYLYGGYTKSEIESLSSQGATCTNGYTSDKVRLLTISEYHNLSQQYNNSTYPCSNGYSGYFTEVNYITTRLSGNWLYANGTIYNYWTTGTVTSGGGGNEKYAFYVKPDGTFAVTGAYSQYEIRPVIVIKK